jgi:hypothetical protein
MQNLFHRRDIVEKRYASVGLSDVGVSRFGV